MKFGISHIKFYLLQFVFTLNLLSSHAVFLQDIEQLTQDPHRLTGTIENQRAAEYIENRLNKIGVEQVAIQNFPVMQSKLLRCDLEFEDGKKLQLQPMRANRIILPVTPKKGINSSLLYLGQATEKEIEIYTKGKVLEDFIAILNYNSGEDWLRVFRMGAKAVIFIREGDVETNQSHYVDTNANLPRFFYKGKLSDLPNGKKVKLHSEILWEQHEGKNIFAFFKGTQPRFNQEIPETILISAPLDSYGEVPGLAKGARSAANCAALLQLAEHFKTNRPRRNILLGFFDGEARGLSGSTNFYKALENDPTTKMTLPQRQQRLEKELLFINNLKNSLVDFNLHEKNGKLKRSLTRQESVAFLFVIISFLGIGFYLKFCYTKSTGRNGKSHPVVLAIFIFIIGSSLLHLVQTFVGHERVVSEDELHREIIFRMKDRARAESLAIRFKVTELREQQPSEKQNSQILELEFEKRDWNSIQRAISQNKFAELDKKQTKKITQVLRKVREQIIRRSEELDRENRNIKTSRNLKNLLTRNSADNTSDSLLINIHLSLMLGDATNRWGVVLGGDANFRSRIDQAGLYGKVQSAFFAASKNLSEQNLPNFETKTVDGSLESTRGFMPTPFMFHSGEIAGLYGHFNVVLGTAQDRLVREGTPDDNLENLNPQKIQNQVTEITKFLTELGNIEALSLRKTITPRRTYLVNDFLGLRKTGAQVMAKLRGSSMPDTPLAQAIIELDYRPSAWATQSHERSFNPIKPTYFDNFKMLQSDSEGFYEYGPFPGNDWRKSFLFAIKTDEMGAVQVVSNRSSSIDSGSQTQQGITAFQCREGGNFSVLPSQFFPINYPRPINGKTNTALLSDRTFFETRDGVTHWYSEQKIEQVKLFGPNSETIVTLNNGERSKLEPEFFDEKNFKTQLKFDGVGIDQNDLFQHQNSTQRSATDLWRLNEHRLGILRAKRINSNSVEELHGLAEQLISQSQKSLSPIVQEALTASAYMSEKATYQIIRNKMDDLISAVLILLALAIPFAFALERLLIGARTIYHQVLGFTGFFTISFLVLYFTHPAFAIAKTPVIIFLGFTVITLSSLVIMILLRKFENEVKVLQGTKSSIHIVDISRFGTMMAAMSMGISSMRRRSTRTVLTMTTIILLTFTILCFAAFDKQIGIRKTLIEPSPNYSGVMIQHVNRDPLSDDVLKIFKGRWRKEAAIFSRYWIAPENQNNSNLIVTQADGSNPTAMKGLLGFDAKEISFRDDFKKVLNVKESTWEDQVLLSKTAAELLGVKEGDTIFVGGIKLKLGRLFDSKLIASLADMDASEILPVDFNTKAMSLSNGEEMGFTEVQNWTTLPADFVALLSIRNAKRLGAYLSSIHLYTKDTQQSTDLAETAAKMVPLPVVATRKDGVYLNKLDYLITSSGARDLFFPIVLGALIIFATMLSSVKDRENEIFTFSALGLAPPHIASLFFVEALIYSVVGGLGGYFLAQCMIYLLTFMEGLGLTSFPEMNYSSTNAIFAMLIIMTTVLASSIYPAILASRSANPGVLRSWKLPQPEGDVMNIIFPFTVSDYDITGVVSFLKEHFDNFNDAGLGHFIAQETQLVKLENNALCIKSKLALSPFDLGVTQKFELKSSPSEIEGIDEIVIRIERVSGQPKDWQRLNKILMNDLRKQFLIWRSLSQESVESYRETTLMTLGENHGS